MGQPANGVKLIAGGGTAGLIGDNRARPFALAHRHRLLVAAGLLALLVAFMLLAVALVLAFFVLAGGGGPAPPSNDADVVRGAGRLTGEGPVIAQPPGYPAPPSFSSTPASTTSHPRAYITSPPPLFTTSSTPPSSSPLPVTSAPPLLPSGPTTAPPPTSAPLRHYVLPACPVVGGKRPPRPACPDVRVRAVDVLSPPPPTEAEISAKLHWAGVTPVNYRLDLSVLPDGGQLLDGDDSLPFRGTVTVVLLVKGDERPSTVYVHANASAIEVTKLTLSRRCGGPAPCVKSASRVKPFGDVLAVQLASALEPNVHYELTIEYYGRRVGFGTGLYLSRTAPYAPASQRHAAVSTLFQLRHARLVVPSVDHPALKATLDLCLGYPVGLTALGNAPASGRLSATKEPSVPCGRVRTCFASTPPLPTYLYAFALLQNYTVAAPVVAPANRSIRVVHPTADGSAYAWMAAEAAGYVAAVQKTVDVPLMSAKLDLLVARTPFWGIENMGLVGLDASYMKLPEREQPHSILAHEIIHQWLGNVVTARRWDDVCLQEGLTAYMEWRLSHAAGRISLGSHVIKTHMEVMNQEAKTPQPPIVRPFVDTQQIADDCFKKPPLIFHMLRQTFGDDLLQHLLRTLVHRYKFASAGLEDWQAVLAEKSPEAGAALGRWFTEPGYALVVVTRMDDPPNATRLHQANALGRTTFEHAPARPFLFGLSAVTSDGWKLPAGATLLNGTDSIVARVVDSPEPTPAGLHSWTLYNVDRSALARVVYDARTYTNLLNDCIDTERPLDWRPKCQALASWHPLNYALHDLCWGVTADQIPASANESSVEWAPLARLLVAYSDRSTGMLDLPGGCRCCFMTEEQLTNERTHPHLTNCRHAWHRTCAGTKLVQVLGTNFTLPDDHRHRL